MPRGNFSLDILQGRLWLALQRNRKHLSGVLTDGKELAHKGVNSMGMSEMQLSRIPMQEVYGKGESRDRACYGDGDKDAMIQFNVCFFNMFL